MRAETAHAVLLLVVIAGLGLAVFATAETFDLGLRSACSVNPYISCSKVDSSGHTTVGIVPDWAIGVAGFVVLLVLELPLYATWRRDLLAGLVIVSGLGVIASLYFGYVELVVISALCPVCFSTYLANAVVFLLGTWLFLKGRTTESGANDDEPTPPSTDGKGSASG
jgi:uncharacterized membrane protein